jgi:hypothetical protein
MIKTYFLTFCFLFAFATSCWSQHEGDVDFTITSGKIVIENGNPSFVFADKLFEGAFGTAGPFDGISVQPGFASDLPTGNTIGFSLLPGHNGHFLHYFHPTSGLATTLHGKELTVSWGAQAADRIITSSVDGGNGLIAPTSPTFDHHLDFELASKGAAHHGAYGLLMQLNTTESGVTPSDPFWVFLNYGMESAAFESAVSTIAAVPEPSSILLASLGTVSAWGIRRIARRRTR